MRTDSDQLLAELLELRVRARPHSLLNCLSRTAGPFGRLVYWAVLFALVAAPLQAQQSSASLTGPCTRTGSSSVISLKGIVDNPETPPMLKSGWHLPDFPAEVERPGYEGKVVVAFIVNDHGRVEPSSVVVMSSTDSLLSRWACKVIPGIRFEPARDHGHPVRTQAVMPFIYHGLPATDSTDRPQHAAMASDTSSCPPPNPAADTTPGQMRHFSAGGHLDRSGRQFFYSFEVAQSATLRNDSPRPAAVGRGTVLAQFMVDTSGRVEPNTWRIVKASDSLVANAVLAVIPALHFTPAEQHTGCRVRQLVQMPFTFR